MVPRAVLVHRPTVYRQLLAAHGTHGQAKFFLDQRGQPIDPLFQADGLQQRAIQKVAQAIPADWRQARVQRVDLDRFLFEPEDVVLAVGQDGLVANVARFLDGQVVVGFNPDPSAYDGVLVPHAPTAAAGLLGRAAQRDGVVQRTMVEAVLDDGSRLRALNEIFVGHPTHQSARYAITVGDQSERHSSSGLIVATGTGCTGWARSIRGERASCPDAPSPGDPAVLYLVREAFPSRVTGTALTAGLIADRALTVRSEMDQGVIFGDGIETDRLGFGWGRTVQIQPSERGLALLEAG